MAPPCKRKLFVYTFSIFLYVILLFSSIYLIFCSYTILPGDEQIVEDKHVHFGLAIKNARMDCGLTQEALAERAGISCRYLIAIENEGRIPKLPAVYRLIHSLPIRRV